MKATTGKWPIEYEGGFATLLADKENARHGKVDSVRPIYFTSMEKHDTGLLGKYALIDKSIDTARCFEACLDD